MPTSSSGVIMATRLASCGPVSVPDPHAPDGAWACPPGAAPPTKPATTTTASAGSARTRRRDMTPPTGDEAEPVDDCYVSITSAFKDVTRRYHQAIGVVRKLAELGQPPLTAKTGRAGVRAAVPTVQNDLTAAMAIPAAVTVTPPAEGRARWPRRRPLRRRARRRRRLTSSRVG